MYKGRSIGRMLMFLREYSWHADNFIFQMDEKGSIKVSRNGSNVVHETTFDEYDTPHFVFNNTMCPGAMDLQKERKDEIVQRERNYIEFCLDEKHKKCLLEFENLEMKENSKDFRDNNPIYYHLERYGLLKFTEHDFFGFEPAKTGGGEYMVHTYKVEITPQGKGMREYLLAKG